jgi:hypothetical protein
MENRYLLHLLLIPFVLFLEYVVFIIIGCVASGCGMKESFFCGTYCITGKIVLLITGLFFVTLLCFDIKKIRKKNKLCQDQKEND